MDRLLISCAGGSFHVVNDRSMGIYQAGGIGYEMCANALIGYTSYRLIYSYSKLYSVRPVPRVRERATLFNRVSPRASASLHHCKSTNIV
jgi:hypothetical protein